MNKKLLLILCTVATAFSSQFSETAYVDYWGNYPGEIYNFTFCDHTCELLGLPQNHFTQISDTYTFFDNGQNQFFSLEPWNHSLLWGKLSNSARMDLDASLNSISSRGRGLGRTEEKLYMYNPNAITAYSHGDDLTNSDKTVYIVDSGNNRIGVMDYCAATDEMSFNSYINNLYYPLDADVFDGGTANNSSLWVTEYNSNSVSVFTMSGELMTRIFQYTDLSGNLREFSLPDNLVLSRTGIDIPEKLYLIQGSPAKLHAFTIDNQSGEISLQEEWNFADFQMDYQLSDMDIDAWGDLLITDYQNSCLYKIKSDGTYLCDWGIYGQAYDRLNHPLSVNCIRGDDSRIVVSDLWSEYTGVHYFRYGADILNISITPAALNEISVQYTLTNRTRITLALLDEGGNLIDEIFGMDTDFYQDSGIHSSTIFLPGSGDYQLQFQYRPYHDLDSAENEEITLEFSVPDQTLSGYLSSGVHEISGDVMIPAGSTSFLEYDAILRFAENSSLQVYGNLNAVGYDGYPIIFEAAGNDWNGIHFTGETSSMSRLEHCIIRGSSLSGLTFTGSSPTIESCTISGNASENGAGLFIGPGSHPQLINCTISENTASQNGGGIFLAADAEFESTGFLDIRQNAAQNGGGIFLDQAAAQDIHDVTISENSALSGAGIFCSENSQTVIEKAHISDNSAEYAGGGLYLHLTDYSSIRHSLVVNNQALTGGGLSSLRSDIVFQDVTLSNNSGYGIYTFDGSDLHVTNSILWANFPGQISFGADYSPGTAALSYSIVEGGLPGIETHDNGSILQYESCYDQDPRFVSSQMPFDYHFTWKSPCLNNGSPAFQDPDGSISDIGAVPFNFEPGDLNGDWAVNVLDMPWMTAWILYPIPEIPTDNMLYLSDLAPVPRDDWIDILDCVGLFSIILGREINQDIALDGEANLFLSHLNRSDQVLTIALESTVPVAGFQFDLEMDSGSALEVIESTSNTQQFELEYREYDENHVRILVYPLLVDAVVQPGIHEVLELRFTQSDLGKDNQNIELINPVISDQSGRNVCTGNASVENIIPDSFDLGSPYPNPFNPITAIRYELPVRCEVQVTVLDALGRQVSELVKDDQEPGSYTTYWDAAGNASGIYFVKLQTADYNATVKVVLLK